MNQQNRGQSFPQPMWCGTERRLGKGIQASILQAKV